MPVYDVRVRSRAEATITVMAENPDDFEDEEEEAEAAPTQYACRKIMEVMDLLRAANRERLLGA